MCIIAFCLQTTPGFPLLVAANRDERRRRPTQAAAPWQLDNGVQVLSGRDLTDGGTWMGCARNGRVAMLTNIRPTDALTEKARLSRGLLCADWLEGASLTTWLGQHVGGDFGGCNVVLGELTSGAWHFLRNHPETAADCVDNQLAPTGVGWWGCPLERVVFMCCRMQASIHLGPRWSHCVKRSSKPPLHRLIPEPKRCRQAPCRSHYSRRCEIANGMSHPSARSHRLPLTAQRCMRSRLVLWTGQRKTMARAAAP